MSLVFSEGHVEVLGLVMSAIVAVLLLFCA